MPINVAKQLDGSGYHLVWRKASAREIHCIVLDGDPAHPWKGAQQLPTFGHVYRGQTVAHLSNSRALVRKPVTVRRTTVA